VQNAPIRVIFQNSITILDKGVSLYIQIIYRQGYTLKISKHSKISLEMSPYRHSSMLPVYHRHEKREYGEQIREVELAFFTTLVLAQLMEWEGKH